jgi:hypothetical protein
MKPINSKLVYESSDLNELREEIDNFNKKRLELETVL